MKTTKAKSIWSDDPVVQEVRRARARLWKEGGGTIEGLMRVVKLKAARIRRGDKSKGKRAAPA
jgi:hypothetical protein